MAGKSLDISSPPATAIPFKQGFGITEKKALGAVLQARMIKRLVDYTLTVPGGFTMLHKSTVVTGEVVIDPDGELFIL